MRCAVAQEMKRSGWKAAQQTNAAANLHEFEEANDKPGTHVNTFKLTPTDRQRARFEAVPSVKHIAPAQAYMHDM